MAKYDRLFRHLCAHGDAPVTMTFADIERLCGPLPAQARRLTSWWSNEVGPRAPAQARAWCNAGRTVVRVDRDDEQVEFSAPTWLRGA